MSPVCSQSPASTVDAESVECQYPLITPGDRAQISPSWPAGSIAPKSSWMDTSQPGTGRPTLPTWRAPRGLAEMSVADSVQPYPS